MAVLAPTFTSGARSVPPFRSQCPLTGVLAMRALATAGWLKPT